jgi:hypothetical protein
MRNLTHTFILLLASFRFPDSPRPQPTRSPHVSLSVEPPKRGARGSGTQQKDRSRWPPASGAPQASQVAVRTQDPTPTTRFRAAVALLTPAHATAPTLPWLRISHASLASHLRGFPPLQNRASEPPRPAISRTSQGQKGQSL